MKKILCLLLCVIMLVSVVACSDDDAVTPPDDTSNSGNNNAASADDWDTEGYHIYVSTTGSDSNDGLTAEKSVKTINRAQEIAKTYVGNSEKLPVIISLEKGEYLADDTISVISGSADTPVIFTSRNGRAVIAGGTKISKDNIKPCTDTWVLGRIQSDQVKEKLYEVDLTDYSRKLTSVLNGLIEGRARYDVVEFYRGDETLVMSRWPNDGERAPGAISKNNLATGFELTYYINYNYYDKDAGENVFKTPTEAKELGIGKTNSMNVFLSDATYEAVKDWDFKNQDIYSHNFFAQDWDDMIHKVTGFTDVSESPLTFDGNAYKAYFTTDRGRYYNNPVNETKPFRRFNFFNALEAIDLDGEYYYDFANKKMYVYFEDTASLDNFYIATNQRNVLTLDHVEHVTFRNVDVRYTQSNLITVYDSNNISFIGCSLSNAALKAALVYRSTNVTFKDSYIYDLGAGALYFRECNVPTADELVSAELLVENCDIGFIDHRDLTYCYIVDIDQCTGVTIRNNTCHDAAHGAFRIYIGALVTYENNEIYNFLDETDDGGLFYGYCTLEAQVGIVVRNNYIHNIGADWQVWAIVIFYCDNQTTGYSVYNNVITDISRGGNGKGHIFANLILGEDYSNVIANTGENIGITRGNRGDDIFWHWRDMYSEKTIRKDNLYERIQKFGLANGAWDDSLAATDETRNYSYKMMKYVMSEEFYYSVYGTGIAQCTGLKEYIDADYYVQMNNETIKDFTIKVKTGTYAGEERTFDNIDDFFDFLYDNCGYTFAMTTLPNSFEIYYYGSETYEEIRVYEMYPPMYTYNQKTAEWEFSRAAGYRGINESNMWDKTNTNCMGEQMGRWQFRAENTTNLGTYHDNLTLNMHMDFTEYDRQERYHNGSSKYNNYDTDIEGLEVVLDGEYTGEFLDILDTVKSQGMVPDLVLPDLSTVGCNLKAK